MEISIIIKPQYYIEYNNNKLHSKFFQISSKN